MKTSTADLQDFVTHQAVEDAALPSGERIYQAKLVADVLRQEAPNGKALNDLLALYRAEKQAA